MELGASFPRYDSTRAAREALAAGGWQAGRDPDDLSILYLFPDEASRRAAAAHVAWLAQAPFRRRRPDDTRCDDAIRTTIAWANGDATERERLSASRRAVLARAKTDDMFGDRSAAWYAADAAYNVAKAPTKRYSYEDLLYLALDSAARAVTNDHYGKIPAARAVQRDLLIALLLEHATHPPIETPEPAPINHDLVARICAEPHDDTPRLAYADYLSERGDPRGQLINLQCRLASMSPLDDAYPATRAAERRLLARHVHTWNTPLFDLLEQFATTQANPLPYSVRAYHRGFPARLALPAADVLRAETLLDHAPLDVLYPDTSQLERTLLEQYARLPARVRERTVHLVDGADLPLLPERCPYLYLQDLQLDDSQLPALRRLRPRHLAVRGDLPPGPLRAWLDADTWTDVDRLDIRHASLSARALDALLQSRALTRLGTLALYGDQAALAPDTHARRLADTPQLDRLTGIHLDYCLTNEALTTLLRERPLTHVQGLSSHAQDRNANRGAAALCDTLRDVDFPSLAHLDLSLRQLPNAFDRVCTAAWLPRLVSLHLSGTKLSDDTVARLLDAVGPRLGVLDLTNTRITDATCRRLAATTSLPNLWYLRVWPNHRVTADGLEAIAASKQLRLAYLGLPMMVSEQLWQAYSENIGGQSLALGDVRDAW